MFIMFIHVLYSDITLILKLSIYTILLIFTMYLSFIVCIIILFDREKNYIKIIL